MKIKHLRKIGNIIGIILTLNSCKSYTSATPKSIFQTKSKELLNIKSPTDTIVYENVSNSGTDVIVDFSQVAKDPIIKSKIGFARNVAEDAVADSIDSFLSPLGPGMFCSGIEFDHWFKFDGEGATNPALNETLQDPNDPNSRPIFTSNSPTVWLKNFQEKLKSYKIQVLHEIIGAPAQYQTTLMSKPAIHRAPTNINAAANFMSQWFSKEKHGADDALWSIWIEPGHTLQGVNKKFNVDGVKAFKDETDAEFSVRESAQRSLGVIDLANIYENYVMAAQTTKSDNYKFGLGAFLSADFEATKLTTEGEVFFAQSMKALKTKADNQKSTGKNLQLDFLSFHSFNGSLLSDLNHAKSSIGDKFPTVPFILTQYAPAILKATEGLPADLQPSVMQVVTSWLSDLDFFYTQSTIKNVCFSYWIGGNYGFLHINKNTGILESQHPYEAMKLISQIPATRRQIQNVLEVNPDNPKLGLHGWAASDDKRAQLFMWNDSATEISQNPKLFNIPKSILSSEYIKYTATLSINNPTPIISTYVGGPITIPAYSIVTLVYQIKNKTSQEERRLSLSGSKVLFSPFNYVRNQKACEPNDLLPGINLCYEDEGKDAQYDYARDILHLTMGKNTSSLSAQVNITNSPDSLFLNFYAYGINDESKSSGDIGLQLKLNDCLNGNIIKYSAKDLQYNDYIGNGASLKIDLKSLASKCNWDTSSKSITMDFYMNSINPHAQAKILFSDKIN